MHDAVSVNGVPIRLTEERWGHISYRHPELAGLKQEILETISSPDIIQEGDFDTLMAARRIGNLNLVVIYKETSPEDGFIVTAYLAERLRRRRVVWKR